MLDGIKGQRIIAGAHADATGGVCPMVAADVHLPWKTVSPASVETAQQAARAWDRYAEVSGSSRAATKRQLLALTSMLEVSILNESSQGEITLSGAIADYERGKSGHSRRETPMVRDTVPSLPVGRTRYLGLEDAYEVPADSPVEMPARRRPVQMSPEHESYLGIPAERPAHVEAPWESRAAAEAPIARPSSPDVPAERPSFRKRQNTGERDRTAELEERGGWAWLRPFRSYDEYEETLLRALEELDSHERQLGELQAR
ncbi:MAG: hypothetical protein M3065_17280 [Actinomycetota bacterium]|nr:hypothetical protein [Actinomycetota bacterium]